IEPNRPLIHILKIKFHPMIKRDIAAPIHLPKAGDARTYAESPSLPVFAEPLIIPHGQRTRPHQTHFSSENIKKLGQFVKAGAPQNSSNDGDAGIVSDLENRP